jgi:hypothetical protein
MQSDPLYSRLIHSTPPRLRTGASMDLACFWPSPTSKARRERQCQRRASGVWWWVGTVRRFCVYEGVDYHDEDLRMPEANKVY